jgi:hypothetical protein
MYALLMGHIRYRRRTTRGERRPPTLFTGARFSNSLERTKTPAPLVAAYSAPPGPGVRTTALITGLVRPTFIGVQLEPPSVLSKTPAFVPA